MLNLKKGNLEQQLQSYNIIKEEKWVHSQIWEPKIILILHISFIHFDDTVLNILWKHV